MDVKLSELYFNIRALRFAGISLSNGKSSKFQTAWYIFVLVPFITMHSLCVLKFFFAPYSLIRTIITAYIFNNGFQWTFRVVYFNNKKQVILDLLQFINSSPTGDSLQLKLQDAGMRLQSTKHTRRFSSIIFFYNVVGCVILGVMGPLVIRAIEVARCSYKDASEDLQCDKKHPVYVYEIWWPTDIYAVPTYYYLIAWQVLMCTAYFAITCTTDAFACSLMLAAADRASLLARRASQALLPGPGCQITPQFKAWVRYHQHYLRIVDQVNDVMGPLIFVTHLFAVLNIISYLYFLLKFHDPTISNMALSVMVGFLIQIFTYATAGQKILIKSKELSASTLWAAAHINDGGLGSGEARSGLQILSARCSGSQLEQINGMGYFTVSLDLFAKVLSASISYLLVILQLCNCTEQLISYEEEYVAKLGKPDSATKL